MSGRHVIPTATLAVVEATPPERSVALLLRHSVRGPLPPGEPGNDVPLTEEGCTLARELGVGLGDRLRTLRTSPVPRCVQTAHEVRRGAGKEMPMVADAMLGDPGAYVVDGVAAWAAWCRFGHEGVMEALMAGDRLNGLADPFAASHRLVEHLVACSQVPGVHVFVTHDSLVTVAAAHSLSRFLSRHEWPDYLDALAIVHGGAAPTAHYRDYSGPLPW